VDNLTSSLHGNYLPTGKESQVNGRSSPQGAALPDLLGKPSKMGVKRRRRRLKRRRRDRLTSNGKLILMSLVIFVSGSVLGFLPGEILDFLTRIISMLKDP